MKNWPVILSLALASCTSHVTITRVIDGDTVVTSDSEHIRLAELDCPELSQPYGLQARRRTVNLCEGRTLKIKRTATDKYGRTVAELYNGHTWINKLLVDSGDAWAYKKYSSLYPDEIQARRRRVGLWSEADPIPPFKWRKQESKQEK